jgi:hypothetical protein
MPLTACRECGTAMPAHSPACPKCGARTAPASYAGYRPAPPRPEEPERPGWLTAAGWVAAVAVCALFALFLYRLSTEADQNAAGEAEMAREQEHMVRVVRWMQDTSASAPVPESAGRPVPASDLPKRLWAISRMLVDGRVWEREVMERHGAGNGRPPAAWSTPGYLTNARAHPEVGTYLEGRAAAIAEIEKTSDAWLEERAAVLARESGLPASEIRGIFPGAFVGVASDEARMTDAMLQMHRHMVRVDPRVRPAAGDRQLWEREDDYRRFEELVEELNDATASFQQARGKRVDEQVTALNQWIR